MEPPSENSENKPQPEAVCYQASNETDPKGETDDYRTQPLDE